MELLRAVKLHAMHNSMLGAVRPIGKDLVNLVEYLFPFLVSETLIKMSVSEKKPKKSLHYTERNIRCNNKKKSHFILLDTMTV